MPRNTFTVMVIKAPFLILISLFHFFQLFVIFVAKKKVQKAWNSPFFTLKSFLNDTQLFKIINRIANKIYIILISK